MTALPADAADADVFNNVLAQIVATIGPASSDDETIERLIRSGVSIFRLNFSHGKLDEHEERLASIRRVAVAIERPTAVLGDLQGPKIRVGRLPEEGVHLETGQLVAFECGDATTERPAEPERLVLRSTYDGLVKDVAVGHRVLLNDGALRMLVIAEDDETITCTVTHGGHLTSGKGINVPDSLLSLRTMTDRDWSHVEWAIEHDLDFLALSFVRSADDIRDLREGIAARVGSRSGSRSHMPIIAKIELPPAVAAIDEIVAEADAIMVARGDLGVEMDLARVPVIQKQIMRASQSHGRPCIVATQMLESMVQSPSPTRAEANDVACAIFDGADAVMLSGETAVGRFPVLAVEYMCRIARETEAHLASLPSHTSAPTHLIEQRDQLAALAHGAWTMAQDVEARCVVAWSQTGRMARLLGQNAFTIPILAATSDARASRRMQVLRAVVPWCVPAPATLDGFIAIADQRLLQLGLAEPGDRVVVVAGRRLGVADAGEHVGLHEVGR